jgi:hypothetical protein
VKKTLIATSFLIVLGAASANAAPGLEHREGFTNPDKATVETDTLNYGKGPSKPLGPRADGGGVITYDESGSKPDDFWAQLWSWFGGN